MNLSIYEAALANSKTHAEKSVPFYIDLGRMDATLDAFAGRSIEAYRGIVVRPPFDDMWIEATYGNDRVACRLHRMAPQPEMPWSSEPSAEYKMVPYFSFNAGLALAAGEAFALDGAGHVLPTTKGSEGCVVRFAGGGADRCAAPDIHDEAVQLHLRSLLGMALFVCALCHCTNIGTEEQPLSRATRKRLRAKYGGAIDDVRVKTLTIAPFSLEPPRGAHRGNAPTPMRLHMVRGHFATYTPERPLFGRIVGQVWVPQHERGSGPGRNEHRYHVDPFGDARKEKTS